MKRTVIRIASAATFIAGCYSIYHFLLDVHFDEPTPSFWLAIVLPMALWSVSGALFIWSLSNNLYGIKHGTVINHRFTAAHMVPAVNIPGTPKIGNNPGSPAINIPAH